MDIIIFLVLIIAVILTIISLILLIIKSIRKKESKREKIVLAIAASCIILSFVYILSTAKTSDTTPSPPSSTQPIEDSSSEPIEASTPSNTPAPSSSAEASSTEEPVEQWDTITYEAAFNYIKQCEENIINSNKGSGVNKYGETAADVLIFSDEYAGLYCAYWSALEEIGEPDDSRFEKSKLRWQIDYTNEEWKQRLLEAYEAGGESLFCQEHADIYTEEVFPVVEQRWLADQ